MNRSAPQLDCLASTASGFSRGKGTLRASFIRGSTDRSAAVAAVPDPRRFLSETLAAQGEGLCLNELLARSADLSQRIGRDFLGHVA